MERLKQMYKLEITTNDNRETLLQEYFFTTWADAYDRIETFKKLDLDVFIRLYDADTMENLGEFTHIKKKYTPYEKNYKSYINTKQKKIKLDNIIIILLGIALFPVLTTINLVKKQ